VSYQELTLPAQAGTRQN